MRWLVEAADTKTGEETEITVEALTEAEAEILARYNGLLVSKVYKLGKKTEAPVVPYAKPEVIEAAPPDFSRIVRRARSTRRLGVALTVLGWFGVACAVGIFGYVALRNGWGDWANWRAWLSAATGSAAWLVALAGVALVSAGSALQLLAAMALVLRIAARQGQRQREMRPAETSRAESAAA